MTEKGQVKHRFEAILNECTAHTRRLNQAVSRCGAFFPLSSTTYAELSDDQVEHVDQLVYRFTKLQDALGAKLFPLIASVLREDAESLTVFDVLAELEKAGAIPDASDWASLRETRNQLTHDYGDDPEESSQQPNEVMDQVDKLKAAARQAEPFVRERVLPSLPAA